MGDDNALAVTPPAPAAVLQWLIAGAAEHDIIEALRAKYPDADPRQTLAAVRDHLAAEGQPEPDALRGWVLVSLRELYRRMLEVGDFDGARKVLKNITEIGL
jgi:hypothetical protein